MTLIVAEKPSVARDIARVMGCKQFLDGRIVGEQYVVTWALGHLITLSDPDEVNPAWKKWSAATLPMLPGTIPLKIIPKTRAQFNVIAALMRDPSVDCVICATDAGREGELIFRRIYHMAKCTKPVERLWISSMTDAAIRAGFAHLRPASDYDGLADSARCRAEADWLVGMNASRAFTLRYNALLSVGRVQTPTLAAIVRRTQEIRDFVPTEYREITADFGDYTGTWFDEAQKEHDTRIADPARATAIAKAVRGKIGTIEAVTRETKTQPPPPLFDLTALQRRMSECAGFTAARTLKTAQSLYETRKLITYPRTDSRHLPPDAAPGLLVALKSIPFPAARPLHALSELPLNKRVFDASKVTDHHAIIPTATRPGVLTPDERAVYEQVCLRTIAAFYEDYAYESALAITRVNQHAFRTRGVLPQNMGWKAVYAGEEKDDDKRDGALPQLIIGDTREVLKASVRKKATKPPLHYTDSTLLAMMERPGHVSDPDEAQDLPDSGLGTPATRAAIIERLVDVSYVTRTGKSLIATQKGEQLILAVPPEIASPITTGRWERALNKMTHNEGASPEKFMESIVKFTEFLVTGAKNAPHIAFERETRQGTGNRKQGTGNKGQGARV